MMIKLSKFKWILFFAVPLFFMACGDDDSADPKNIVEVALDDDQFSTLTAALTRVGLVPTLEGTGPFTVFAPTNAAFTASNINIDNLTDAELTEVLLYHVLGAEVTSSAIAEGQTYATTAANTGPGDTQLSILIEKTAAGAVSLNGSVNVTSADVEATNGVIHVIDRVLSPLDLVGHATANSNFSTLATALGDASLVATLQTDGPFTVFAPLNSAFADIATTVAGLSTEQLAKVLLYHVVGSANVRSSALTDGMNVVSANADVPFTVNITGTDVTITDAGGGEAKVVLTDVQATNGVIHVLNKVIIPDNL